MNNIRVLRTNLGMKQSELAKHLQISQSTLSNWERGDFEPDQKSLIKLSDFFNVATDYLIGRNTPPKSHNGAFDGLDDDDMDMLKQMAQHLREKKEKKDEMG